MNEQSLLQLLKDEDEFFHLAENESLEMDYGDYDEKYSRHVIYPSELKIP
jgi:hypothetical protein